MFSQQQILGALLGSVILAAIALLVYRKKLTEERAALWLAAGLLIFIVSVSGAVQRMLGDLLGSKNVPATILAVGVLFLLAICLDLSVQVTRLTRRAKNVSQEQALLEHRVADLEKGPAEARDETSASSPADASR
jgi:hypothetical protein